MAIVPTRADGSGEFLAMGVGPRQPAQIAAVARTDTGDEKADDQKRTLTPREAIDAGANWLVIGRPIYAAENPRAAAEKILASLGR